MWLTNSKNHIVENLPGRIKWYAFVKLDTPVIRARLSIKERKFLAGQISKHMTYYEYRHGQTPKRYSSFVNNLTGIVQQNIKAAIDGVYDDIDQTFGQKRLDKDEVKRSWWSYIQPLYTILQEFEAYQDLLRQRFRNRRIPRGRSVRKFTMLPMSDFTAHYVHIDTMALHDLLTAAGDRFAINIPKAQAISNKDELWAHAFNFDRMTSNLNADGTPGDRRFHFSIDTDGVGARVHIMRPVRPDNEPNPRVDEIWL
jgi:hypothetical protein